MTAKTEDLGEKPARVIVPVAVAVTCTALRTGKRLRY